MGGNVATAQLAAVRVGPVPDHHMTKTANRFHPAFPLVDAKMQPPAERPGTIERPYLVRLLAAAPGPPVISLVAPPGYGKTTLLVQWARRARRDLAWLTIDDLDNDPAVLLSYLAAAFDRIEPVDDAIRASIAAPRQRILATAVPRLASELHRWKRPGLVVIDDAHRLVDRTGLDALAMLIDHLPAGVRVAIAGRNEPALPFARLRAQRELLEIGPDLLALDAAEAGALVSAAGYALSDQEVRALTARTEGWAAGIYLTALGRDRGGTPGGRVAGVPAHDSYVAAYLRSEVSAGLDDADVAFLTRTSVLETVSAPVADVITGMPGGELRLRSLATGNLLIQDLGGAPPAYRYHTLLRDFLASELERREPGVTPELHRRAASWFAAAGNPDRAIGHALDGGHVDDAARLVTAAALPTYFGGQPATLDGWLHALPVPVFSRHPPLAVIAAWVHLINGRPAAADAMADLAEHASFEGLPGDGAASFESQRAMLRAAMNRRGPRDMLANAELAVAQEHPDSLWRSNALWLLASAYLLQGATGQADALYAEAIAAGPQSPGAATTSMAAQASIAMAHGDWGVAARRVRESQALLEAAQLEEMVNSLLTRAVAARVAIHAGDLVRGREELVRAQLIRPLASHGLPWYSVHALVEIARAHLAISDAAGAQVVVREAEQILRRRPAQGVLSAQLGEVRRRIGDAAAMLGGSSTLTNAELRILPLLSTYLSFQDIADRLVISRNTAKTHAMSIYGKLQASSRGEAVERAVELGLLEPFPGLIPGRRPTPD
jgi:LuxR family transcriptional regulator, maltose regulon positive regulatory protein